MRYGGITHKGESGFMRFGAIWCVLVRLGAISCDLISKKNARTEPLFVFLFLNTPCRKGGWMRNFILYWLDTYATFTRFTTCGQGATPRCDAEVRRQGATPTLLSYFTLSLNLF